MSTKTIKNDVMQAMVEGALAEGSKPVAEEALLNKDAFARIGNIVNGVLQAEDALFTGDNMMQVAALGLAKHFGVNPSYAYWEATRKSYVSSYMARNKVANEESSGKSWTRLTARMAKETGLEKPKAPTANASRMAQKRAEEQAKLASIVDSQLVDMMAEFKAKDDFKSAEKIKAELNRREKDKNKGVEEKIKAKRDEIRKAVGKITDLAILDAIIKQIPKSLL